MNEPGSSSRLGRCRGSADEPRPSTEALGLVLEGWSRSGPSARRSPRPPGGCRQDAPRAVDLPPFDRSAMDGYAVRAADTAPGVVAAARRRAWPPATSRRRRSRPAPRRGSRPARRSSGRRLRPAVRAAPRSADGSVRADARARARPHVRCRGEDLTRATCSPAPGARLTLRASPRWRPPASGRWPCTGRREHGAGGHVLAAIADVHARRERPLGVTCRRARRRARTAGSRRRRPGARRRSRAASRCPARARRRAPRRPPRRRRAAAAHRRGVGRAHRVAVHRRAVERRQVDGAGARSAATRPAGVGERHALRPSGASPSRTSSSASSIRDHPPIRDIVRAGCTNPGSLTWCLSSLRQTASRMICLELRVGRAGAQRAAQVGLGHREQAGAQLALGGQADAVAVAAERLGDGGDEAHLAAAVGERGSGARCRGARGRPPRADTRRRSSPRSRRSAAPCRASTCGRRRAA